MASSATADCAAHSGGPSRFSSHENPSNRCAADMSAQAYWSTSLPSTPPRATVPAVVTPSSTTNVLMAAASGGSCTHQIGLGRVRQQLVPRHLDFALEEETKKQYESPSTPPRICSTIPPPVPITSTTPTRYYAVARGRCVGVYTSMNEVYEEIDGYNYHVYRFFHSRVDAERFIDRYFDITQGRRSDPDPRHRSTLVAFCDGATQGTRNWSHQTGVACIFPHNSAWDIVYTCLDAYCTAYRATAKAALAAIKRANTENPTRDQVLYIYTRNQLLVRAMTEWMEKWLENDWRKGDGHPVKNCDVLQSIVEAQGSRRVIWRLADDWSSEWTASVVSAAQDAAMDVGELLDATACM